MEKSGVLALALVCVAVACASSTLSKDVAGLPGTQTQWRDGVCYEVFVRSFADADGDGVGDLRGLTARLDYINDGNPASTRSLGADCIWLMPIAKSASYHGYDVTDYYHVDPRYGTDEDFRELVKAAHKRGIHVIVDFVPNHSSNENPWFQSALKDPASRYRSWYRWSAVNPNQPGPWGQVAWHKSPLRDEYYYGVFWHGMPDLNYTTPAVVQEMQKVTSYWLKEMGVDGFRFDAIPYLVEDGDQLKHTRGTHEVLHVLGDAIRREAPGSFTVGEMGDGSIDILASYYPDQLDSYFAFDVAAGTVEAARTGDATPFFQALSETNKKLPAGRWSPFLTNHDQPRTMTVLTGDVGKARVAASAMMMLPGMAFVYYGEEIGMIGPKPDEQIRAPMQWTSAAGAGFTTGTPWEGPQPDWVSKNVAAQDGDTASLLNHYRRLIQLRNQHPALSAGDLQVGSTSSAAVAAIIRRSRDETVFIALNFGDRLIDSVAIVLPPQPGGQFRLEALYSNPSSACFVVGIASGGAAVTLGRLAPYSLCTFRVLPR